jgi:hypothetical protein
MKQSEGRLSPERVARLARLIERWSKKVEFTARLNSYEAGTLASILEKAKGGFATTQMEVWVNMLVKTVLRAISSDTKRKMSMSTATQKKVSKSMLRLS